MLAIDFLKRLVLHWQIFNIDAMMFAAAGCSEFLLRMFSKPATQQYT